MDDEKLATSARGYVYRHALLVRLTHWVNLVVLVVMLGSGLQIFNAHPTLYWGSRSDAEAIVLALDSRRGEDGELQGFTRVFGWEFETTGVLGASEGMFGELERRGFPSWVTIPGPRWLALGRRWHFFFAWLFVLNGLFYVGYGIRSRHLSRDLSPGKAELKGLGHSLRRHLSLRGIREESERGYNPLQKLSYLAVIFILAPLIVLTGLTMSPWLDSAFSLPELFAGRQSARIIHFIAALGFVLFTLVHVTMVILVGPINHTRAMITGWFRRKEQQP